MLTSESLYSREKRDTVDLMVQLLCFPIFDFFSGYKLFYSNKIAKSNVTEIYGTEKNPLPQYTHLLSPEIATVNRLGHFSPTLKNTHVIYFESIKREPYSF